MKELRGELTGQRLSVVQRAWEKIDTFTRGKVQLEDLCRTFNPLGKGIDFLVLFFLCVLIPVVLTYFVCFLFQKTISCFIFFVYDVRMHMPGPADHRVKNGDLSPSQAVQDFMSTFEFGEQQYCATIGRPVEGGFVSQRDFMEYYTSVSPTIEDDNVFTLMVWNSWLSSRR
jgi:hypothetical protein